MTETEPDVVDGEATEVETLPAVAEQVATMEVERHAPAGPPTVLPSPKEWEAAMAMSSKIANTEFVPKGLRGKPDAVLAAILAGREIGIGPMQALREISILDGRPVFSAALMMSQLRRGGVVVLDSGVSADRAWIKARRQDTGEEAEVEWTFEEASAVVSSNGNKLVDKDNWRNYRGDMLWARCVGRLARRLGSDLLGGMNYTAEEVADFDGMDGSYNEAPKLSPLGKPRAERRADAPKDWGAINVLLRACDGSIDWPTTIGLIVAAWYGEEYDSVKALPAEEQPHFGVRLANFAAIVAEYTIALGDFPPLTTDDFQAALSRAFEGYKFDLEPVDKVLVIPPNVAETPADAPEPEAGPEEQPDPLDEEAAARALLDSLPPVPENGTSYERDE